MTGTPAPGRGHYTRAVLGGTLMGLANLVPGISGGTMLLAAGVYRQFIDAVAEVTRLRLRREPLQLLFIVVAAASVGIGVFAGPVKELVVSDRWIAYSVFVGLTLGGIPTLWRMTRPATPRVWLGTILGFASMSALGIAQQSGITDGILPGGGFLPLVIAGTGGAASMILPGVSGGFVLLLLGQYVPILAAIDRAVAALAARDLAGVWTESFYVFLPVGVGLVVGVALVSNLLRYALDHHRAVTLGVLLGLLAGVVVGLWPFQQGVPPQPGDHIKGQIATTANLAQFDPEDWPVRRFAPTAGQVAIAAGCVVAGTLATIAIGRIGDSGP